MLLESIEQNELVRTEPVSSAALHAVVSAEVDIQVSTAKRYPRSVKNALGLALSLATLDEETAESCIYALPRAGKTIDGPSVRLAEIMASAWGNLRIESRTVEENDKWIVSRGICWDLETNNAVALTVQRRITNKHGAKFDDDMIGVTAAAANSIARRNAIFQVIPRAYINKVYKECRAVAVGDAATLSTKRDKLFQSLQKRGVTADMIFAKLGVGGAEDVTLDHLAILLGIANRIKDGEVTVDEAFAMPKQESDADTKREAAKSTADKAKEKLRAATAKADQSDEPVPDLAFTSGEMNDIASRLAKIEGAPSAQEFVASCKGLTEDQVWARLSEMEGQGAML